ncbi:hypothetical protein AAHC03_04397 [Spirometra sp. Aus1]
MKVNLFIQPNAKPVFQPRWLTVVDQEVDHLQQVAVLQPVNYSALAATILTGKIVTGRVRIYADFSTGLSAVLNGHQVPAPVPEDRFSKLNSGTCFAELDLYNAYL